MTAMGGFCIPDDRGAIATFRLTVAKVSLDGLYVLVGRVFIRAERWADGPGADG